MRNRDERGRFLQGHRLPGPGIESTYRRDIADAVIEWVSEGKSLKSFCDAHPEAPDRASIRRWSIADIDGFQARFREARRLRTEDWADTILEESEAELGSNSMPAVAARQLAVNTKKWLLSKLLPEQYGERVQVEHGHRAEVHIYLPGKAADRGDSARVIEGEAKALEAGSDEPTD